MNNNKSQQNAQNADATSLSENAEKKGMGRTRAIIDWDKVDHLIVTGSNGVQVAANLGICADTLYRHVESEKGMTFAAYFQEKRSKGDSILHNTQYEVAVKTKNPSMLIWLGKQRLGQRDRDEEANINATITIIDARNNSAPQIPMQGIPGPSVDSD